MRRAVWAGVLLVMTACAAPDRPGPAPTPVTPLPISWTPAGGSATVTLDASRPFLQFAPAIDPSEWAGVSQGRELFVAQWQPAPGPRALLDGLGPQFLMGACSGCHQSTGRAEALGAGGRTLPAVLFRLGDAQGEPHPVYGEQLQTAATTGDPEGQVTWTRQPDGRLNYQVQVSGEPLGGVRASARLSPQLLGMGLLDRVPEADLLAWADEEDRDGDGISGRPHWVTEEGQVKLGRFGWKAIQASLRSQSAAALHQDMGLTTSLHPAENCTVRQAVCAEAISGGQPEVSDAALEAINDFLTVLAVPERRMGDPATFNAGAALFEQVGCSSCHRPTLTTGVSSRFAALSHQTFYPYTDLLLHDLGPALDDGAAEKGAQSGEWRTPSLWGAGLVEASGGRFLHDGRASTLAEAVTWHGGEAERARERFGALQASERAALLHFLRGL
ncbi:hypothetical protein K7W42_04545 [Deinococcus sp. HMF7604]|uniref:di-heme oxidoredictase family protein n=1 Tax=Deinococcus betulae TaxID=2873312 RepID=UPI001CCA26EF|nr:hypothetical protein [Deinococcus betulae]